MFFSALKHSLNRLFLGVFLISPTSFAAQPELSEMPVYDWLSRASGQSELGQFKTGVSRPSEVVGGAAKVSQWALNLEDVRLDRAISRWAKTAGYSFRWDADRYLLIAAPTVFEGEFVFAVQQVLESPGILYSEYPLEACVYANNPPLLRITRLGDQTQECR